MDMSSRVQSGILKPYRSEHRSSKKIIFYSCEGHVTEEEYFRILSEDIFPNLKDHISLVSAREHFNKTPKEERTQTDYNEQNKSAPKQVMERMIQFKNDEDNQKKYKFSENQDDEFWLIIDVDDHTDENHIKEFNWVIEECRPSKENLKLAVTNPFFEFWLYAHHLDITDEAINNAVNSTKTFAEISKSFFRDEMSKKANVHMIGNNQKKPQSKDYSEQKVIRAVEICKRLHTDEFEAYPTQLGSHVYKFVQQIINLSEAL